MLFPLMDWLFVTSCLFFFYRIAMCPKYFEKANEEHPAAMESFKQLGLLAELNAKQQQMLVCPSPDCTQVFYSRNVEVRRHMATKHNINPSKKRKTFSCETCLKSFAHRSRLQNHKCRGKTEGPDEAPPSKRQKVDTPKDSHVSKEDLQDGNQNSSNATTTNNKSEDEQSDDDGSDSMTTPRSNEPGNASMATHSEVDHEPLFDCEETTTTEDQQDGNAENALPVNSSPTLDNRIPETNNSSANVIGGGQDNIDASMSGNLEMIEAFKERFNEPKPQMPKAPRVSILSDATPFPRINTEFFFKPLQYVCLYVNGIRLSTFGKTISQAMLGEQYLSVDNLRHLLSSGKCDTIINQVMSGELDFDLHNIIVKSLRPPSIEQQRLEPRFAFLFHDGGKKPPLLNCLLDRINAHAALSDILSKEEVELYATYVLHPLIVVLALQMEPFLFDKKQRLAVAQAALKYVEGCQNNDNAGSSPLATLFQMKGEDCSSFPAFQGSHIGNMKYDSLKNKVEEWMTERAYSHVLYQTAFSYDGKEDPHCFLNRFLAAYKQTSSWDMQDEETMAALLDEEKEGGSYELRSNVLEVVRKQFKWHATTFQWAPNIASIKDFNPLDGSMFALRNHFLNIGFLPELTSPKFGLQAYLFLTHLQSVVSATGDLTKVKFITQTMEQCNLQDIPDDIVVRILTLIRPFDETASHVTELEEDIEEEERILGEIERNKENFESIMLLIGEQQSKSMPEPNTDEFGLIVSLLADLFKCDQFDEEAEILRKMVTNPPQKDSAEFQVMANYCL